MKKILLNTSSCIGCGACVHIDPEHFDFNEDGLAIVIKAVDEETNSLINAKEACPVSAIIVEDAEGNAEEKTTCDCDSCSCTDCHC